MHLIVWEFTVAPDRVAEFEAAYGPDGDWAQLFCRAEGFLGVDLLVGDDGCYVTIDRWTDRVARDAFMASWLEEYRELDARCAGLTVLERLVAAGDVKPAAS